MPKCIISGNDFVISPAEQEYCREHDIPLPRTAPIERLKELTAFRNRRHLDNGICKFSKKKMFTSVAPERGLTVYDVDVWESDQWDPFDYGRSYDFTRPFFEQFSELLKVTPIPNLAVIRSTMENSDYTNGITGAKNCYLVFGASFCEDCLFSRFMHTCKNVVDCSMTYTCELCYGCINVHNGYNLKFCVESNNCSDACFLSNCQSCRNCYGCVNLSNKEYCFYNKQYSKQDYERLVAAIDLGSYEALCREKDKFSKFKAGFPIKYQFGKMNEGSSGNFLTNTKQCTNCWFVSDCEDLDNCFWVTKGKSSFFQFAFGNNSELIYNCQTAGDNVYQQKFCSECWMNSHDLEYGMYNCYGASNCFGCVSVKKKSYCILNKEYSKSEYFELLPRIKSHMRSTGEYGRYFPNYLSPHYYNQSEAIDFFPSTKEQVQRNGFLWRDEEISPPVKGPLIPDNIKDVPDTILNETLICANTMKRYKIVKAELEFYRRHHLPIPRISPFERFRLDSSFLEWKELKPRSCAQCSSSILTPYEVSSVLCESCFQDQRVA